MFDLEQSLCDAWRRIQPKLKSDPDELLRRLARRRTPTLTRPPRAWCLAIRASDRRINPATAIIVPDDAMDLPNDVSMDRYQLHTVMLNARLVRKLTNPVYIERGGEEACEVARKLGVTLSSLHSARLHGTFRIRYIKNLGGKWGNPVPVLSCDDPLDPTGRFFGARTPNGARTIAGSASACRMNWNS